MNFDFPQLQEPWKITANFYLSSSLKWVSKISFLLSSEKEKNHLEKTNGSLKKKFSTFGWIQITCWFIFHLTPAETRETTIRCGFIMKTKFAPKHIICFSLNEFPSVYIPDRNGKFPSRRIAKDSSTKLH